MFSLFQRLVKARYRRRTIATLDGRFRIALREFERRLKFAFSLPLGVLLRPRKLTTPLPLESVRNILLLRYDAIGDAILTTPVWRSIKKYAPHIRVGVVASTRNEAFIRSDADVDEVFVFSRLGNMRIIRDFFRAHKTRWDVVLNLYFHDKTGGAIYAALVAPNAFRATLTHKNKEKYERIYSIVGNRSTTIPLRPIVLQNLDLLRLVMDIPLSEEDAIPSLMQRFIGASVDEEKATKERIEDRLRANNASHYVILNTDASQSYKEWGFENSLDFSERLTSNYTDTQVFWTSAPDRRDPAREALASRVMPRVELLETQSLTQLIAALRGARVVITPDTSVVHFTTALRVPLLAFYLFESEYPPIGSIAEILYPADGRNVRTIPVEDALEAVEKIMHSESSKTLVENSFISEKA
jgi:ADP-heptose:LPS heptosyltransferase